MPEVNFSGRYHWPEAGEKVTLIYSDGYTEEMRFERVDDKDARVKLIIKIVEERPTFIDLQAFVKLAQIPKREIE